MLRSESLAYVHALRGNLVIIECGLDLFPVPVVEDAQLLFVVDWKHYDETTYIDSGGSPAAVRLLRKKEPVSVSTTTISPILTKFDSASLSQQALYTIGLSFVKKIASFSITSHHTCFHSFRRTQAPSVR